MADESRLAEVADEAKWWLSQLTLADRAEKDWRKEAEEWAERYLAEECEGYSGSTRVNLFWSNVQTLKPNVYSQIPSPDVRRRNVLEDPTRSVLGRQAAIVLEHGLRYGVDAWPFDAAMRAARDDMLITGRGVAREVYVPEIETRDDIEVVPPPPLMMPDGGMLSKADADYHGRAPKDMGKCKDCLMFREGACTLVEGKIAANGHCRYWEPAENHPETTYLLDRQPVEPAELDFDKAGKPSLEIVKEERVETRPVFWADFRCSPARTWADVWWVGFKHAMTRDELVDEFGSAGNAVTLSMAGSHDPRTDQGDDEAGGGPREPTSTFSRAEVWEFWCKTNRTRIWVARGHDKIIRKDEDPLRLQGFFPMPAPLYAIERTDSMVPVPEARLYKDQLDELEEIHGRIRSLVSIVKAVAFINGDFTEVQDVKSATDGTLIPLGSDRMVEDVASSLWWWQIQQIVGAIQQLTARAEQCKMLVYEITGISDLMRQSTKERESAAAQRMKGAFGRVRMTPRSQPMAEFARDTLRIKAEIMAEIFQPSSLEQISGVPIDAGTVELLRTEHLRNTTITVATDATISPDVEAEKADAMEYVSAATGFLQQALPMMQAFPAMAPLLLTMLKESSRPFKWARRVEDLIDQTTAQMTQLAMQPPAPPPGAAPPAGAPSPAPNGQAGMIQ